jgi:hypothetical protein
MHYRIGAGRPSLLGLLRTISDASGARAVRHSTSKSSVSDPDQIPVANGRSLVVGVGTTGFDATATVYKECRRSYGIRRELLSRIVRLGHGI